MIKLTPIKTPLLFENAGEIENWKKTFSNHGGLDIETGAFVPLRNVKKMLEESSCAVSFIMDSIAGASEYGSIALCDYSDFKELFAKLKEIGIFLRALAEYGECLVPRRFVWNLTARIHRSGARWGLWATRQSELSTNPPGGAFC